MSTLVNCWNPSILILQSAFNRSGSVSRVTPVAILTSIIDVTPILCFCACSVVVYIKDLTIIWQISGWKQMVYWTQKGLKSWIKNKDPESANCFCGPPAESPTSHSQSSYIYSILLCFGMHHLYYNSPIRVCVCVSVCSLPARVQHIITGRLFYEREAVTPVP